MMSFRALVGWRYFVFVVLLQKIIFFFKNFNFLEIIENERSPSSWGAIYKKQVSS